MTDDTITVARTIALPVPPLPAEVFDRFNADVLRPFRVEVRDAGGTSKVRRTDGGCYFEVTARATLVLDVMQRIDEVAKHIGELVAQHNARRERTVERMLHTLDEQQQRNRRKFAGMVLDELIKLERDKRGGR